MSSLKTSCYLTAPLDWATVFALLMSYLCVSSAHAYSLQGQKWAQPNLGNPITLTYSYNNLLDGGLKGPNQVSLSPEYIRGAIEEALGLWASVAPLNFVEVYDEGGPAETINYPNGAFGQIRFHHRYINGPDVPGNPPTTKAFAYFPTGNNLAGDVFFDHSDPWQPIGQLSTPDILGAAVHELGHSLGLLHTNISNANMYWVFQRSSGLGTGQLHPDDIAGIQAIYGSGVGSVTPLTVPVPEPASYLLLLFGLGILLMVRHKASPKQTV